MPRKSDQFIGTRMSTSEITNSCDVSVVLRSMWALIKSESQRTPLVHWNESVFRFMFVRALLSEYPHVRCDVEWRRYDLLIHDIDGPSLLEFKFYVRPWLIDLRGKRIRPKGGPSKQNFREFCECIEKLALVDDAPWRTTDDVPIAHRFIILAYADSVDMVDRRSYSYWYDEINLPVSTQEKARLVRLLTLNKLHCPVAESHYKCALLEVIPHSK